MLNVISCGKLGKIAIIAEGHRAVHVVSSWRLYGSVTVQCVEACSGVMKMQFNFYVAMRRCH